MFTICFSNGSLKKIFFDPNFVRKFLKQSRKANNNKHFTMWGCLVNRNENFVYMYVNMF